MNVVIHLNKLDQQSIGCTYIYYLGRSSTRYKLPLVTSYGLDCNYKKKIHMLQWLALAWPVEEGGWSFIDTPHLIRL